MNAADLFHLNDLLPTETQDVRERVRRFVSAEVLPSINEYWERAEMPLSMVRRLAGLNIVGGTVEGYGCAGLSHLSAGLVAMELSRGDGSLNTFNAVQSGLVIGAIGLFGNEAQKSRWLPRLATMEILGAFALTEPEHGSDSVALETSAVRQGDVYVLNGAKRWIGLGTVADVVVVWARDSEDGEVKAFVVEKEDGDFPEGYESEVIGGKIAKRAVHQAAIRLHDVRVPIENRLPNANSFKDIATLLSSTRPTVAWEALGHAIAAYEAAVTYVGERAQFGRPLASFQLVQQSLARMLASIVSTRLMCQRASTLADEGRMTTAIASVTKMYAAEKSLEVCRQARELLGGNGLLLENHVARHLLDMEVVHTYEGTDSMQALIVGREITGLSAFR